MSTSKKAGAGARRPEEQPLPTPTGLTSTVPDQTIPEDQTTGLQSLMLTYQQLIPRDPVDSVHDAYTDDDKANLLASSISYLMLSQLETLRCTALNAMTEAGFLTGDEQASKQKN